ncbi:DUF5324 family protein [Wenjunlia tyrosinilytica]|uniref:Uncharacterized protein n=1 Tax=Wenjunlia tyrosinilytica TaxID=1544741 RepID=A0A917ZNR4_9ACTN|nr:hypothetical protein GCM10012280_21600 [Wenjunlia tyrosinilytica]
MTRFADYVDSAGVRAAAEEKYQQLAPRAKKSVRHAAEVVAPYAGTAKETAVQYAGEARQRLAPKVSSAVDQARDALPPRVEHAVDTAAKRTRSTVRQAADYTVPRVEHAVGTALAATEPVREEAVARTAAAVAALRGQVSVAEIEKAVRKRRRRARRGRAAKRLVVIGLVAGGGIAAWKWWNRQTNPEWLVEAPEATEVSDRYSGGASSRTTFDSVDGTGPVVPDPEVQAKQAEADDRKKKPPA